MEFSIREKDSDVQQQKGNQRSRCPECGGRTRTQGHETHCRDCGLVVVDERIDDHPMGGDHGPARQNGPDEWSAEPTTELRVSKGLGGTFNLGKDGRGSPISTERRKQLGRMRRLDKRMSNKAKRCNEALRDAELISGNLGLPEHVVGSAARMLRRASAENVPCGRMAWEALAGGAVLLQARAVGLGRDPEAVAAYAKASHERVCAGARKLRLDLNRSFPPARSGTVDAVLVELDAVHGETASRLGRVGRQLLELADEARIAPGTPRLTVAAASVYAADRLTPGKDLTQAQVVDAGNTIVQTSTSRIARYSQELHDTFVEYHEIETVTPDPLAAD